MEWRAHDILTKPGELRFRNYKKVFMLIMPCGTYEINFRREF